MPEPIVWLVGRLAIVLVAGLMGLAVALAAAYVAGPPAGALEVGTGLVRPLPPPSASPLPIPSATPLPIPSVSPLPIASATPLPPPRATPSPLPSAPPSPIPSVSPPPATLSPQPDPTPLVHIVTPGETVSGIARQYDVTVTQLVELNQLQDPNLILVGRQLLIRTPGE